METAQVALDPYQVFLNVTNPQLNANAFCEKSFIMGLFWRSYANLFHGSVFLDTVYYIDTYG